MSFCYSYFMLDFQSKSDLSHLDLDFSFCQQNHWAGFLPVKDAIVLVLLQIVEISHMVTSILYGSVRSG